MLCPNGRCPDYFNCLPTRVTVYVNSSPSPLLPTKSYRTGDENGYRSDCSRAPVDW